MRLCKQCARLRMFRSINSVVKMCRQQVRGRAAGESFGSKIQIGRRRCGTQRKPTQHKRFLNRTYLPTPDGHVDAFDTGFALPRLTELLEQSFNGMSITSTGSAAVCQATLGLAAYGGLQKIAIRLSDDRKRMWN